MARAVFVTYLIVLFIAISIAYKDECAIGPEYWCKSFDTAKDCGALRHCTDTVWRYDDKDIDSSTKCEWCQKILENSYKGIQHLAPNDESIQTSIIEDCKLFPLATDSSKCTNIAQNYGTYVASILKKNRYATLCRLMNICSSESSTTKTTEKPIIVGQNRCTWGPSYWCSSLSNSRECRSINHCSERVWSQKLIEKKPNDNICQYCEFTIQKLRLILEDDKTEINIEKWLAGACSMLPTKESIDECVQMMSQYADEILALIKTNIDPGVICHLGHMCKEAKLITKVENEIQKPNKEIEIVNNNDEESKMLCHAIVSATHELHANQHKTRDEIQTFLKDDCQKLSTNLLIKKCENLVERYGVDIHGHVASNVELSKICDYFDDSKNHYELQSLPSVHCELCAFVLKTAKYMLDAKQSEDTVLLYIDEQICSRLTGEQKKICKKLVDNNGKDLIDSIQCETKSMLLCTRFQICIDKVFDSIDKNEINSFVQENICNKLGSFQDACNAFIGKNTGDLMRSLIDDTDGDVLCRLVGICPKKMSFLDNLSINDDTNKCKRCIDDFTRRQHIAEKLVNHSADFLHHLCDLLPQKDDCLKAVDQSVNELITFIHSLNAEDICIELKFCNKALLQQIQINSKEISLSNQIQDYVKDEICLKLGEFSALCNKIVDVNDFSSINLNKIDSKTACDILRICPTGSTFGNCNDKCECCMDKIEIHQTQIATFLQSIVNNIKTLCQRMPGSNKCLEMTARLEGNVNKIISRFNARQTCEVLNHCSSLPVEIETLSQCQKRIQSKKEFLLSSISTINHNLKSLCEYIPWNKGCHAVIDRSTLDVNDKLTELNSETLCTKGQSLTDYLCKDKSPFENLCKQLVQFNNNYQRMESLFKSIFNQYDRVEKELCQLDEQYQPFECKPTFKLDNCNDKCDCCVQHYTLMQKYDLQMIENLRNGLLATCDWSLSKDSCILWFNRVCDRMKNKVNKFTPTDYCKKSDLCSTKEQINNQDCKIDGDKCQCCTKRIDSRQTHFRTTVNQVTTTLVSLCNDDDCRSIVQSAQQKTLSQIDKINSQTYCQRFGYCAPEHSSQTIYRSRISANYYHHIGSDIEGLDQRLEAGLATDICFQYGQLRPMCEHLISSPLSRRYSFIYMSLLTNNPKLVDDDLREQISTKLNTDVCDSCINKVKLSKDFWLNSLDSIRDVLLRTCERCTEKDKCRDYYNKRFDNIKSYVNQIDPNQFCQAIHLCSSSSSSSSLIHIKTDQCQMCVDSLQSRKDSLLKSIDRIVSYFDDICQRFGLKQCQVFVKQIQDSIEKSIESFQPKEFCTSIGFCSTINNNKNMDYQQFEKYLEDELDKNLCSTLGPFETLCKHIIHGNIKQVQTAKINYNIKDLMQIGEKFSNSNRYNMFSAANLNECDRDRCTCCINTIDQKKECAKSTIDRMIAGLIRTCDYCPSKDKCQEFWTSTQKRYDSYIDDIDSKQICTRIGYCNASKLCEKMGIFQQSCEEALAAFTQSIEHDKQPLENHLPHTSVVVLPTKSEEENVYDFNDSNSTCILCEYFMNILGKYIHQKSTEQEIEQSLGKVCDGMPSTLRKQCHDFIDNYGPAIIATLIHEFQPLAICRKLNLCTKEMNVELKHLTKANQGSCGVCDYVSTYINFALKRDSSEKSYQHALSTVCSHLSSEQSSQCQTLVQLFASHFRKLNLQLGENFCQQLPMCQSGTDEDKVFVPDTAINPSKKDESTKKEDELKRIVVKNLDDTPQCMLCKYVITYLDTVLKTNKSEAAIEAALERVCTILPKKERTQCDEFVKTYGPVLAELIAEMADPDTICRYLGMCQVVLPVEKTTKQTASVTYPNHDYVRLPDGDKPYTCTICQFLISRMKHFIALNQTEEEIIGSLKQSCDLFSVINLKQQCRDLLDQYGSYIIQMISSDVDPKLACQSIGLCQKNFQTSSQSTRRQSTPPAPLSPSTAYGKCIYGMNYWCTSRQNAELCNAVEICERQVWSKKNKNIVI